MLGLSKLDLGVQANRDTFAWKRMETTVRLDERCDRISALNDVA
ncbi:hypothetical protein [Nostoc sp. KVJ20]|nr:hypothetical protein [Nostoc sp. KVJ20]